MINLFNIDIDQIKFNKSEIDLIKLNGLVIYDGNFPCIEFTVDKTSSRPLDYAETTPDGDVFCTSLPRLYTMDSPYYYHFNYEKVEITLLDGTITDDIGTLCNQIEKVKIWYPKSTILVRFFPPIDVHFIGDTDLTRINYFDVSRLNNFASMFIGCSNLQSINTSNWDTRKVTNMQTMFRACVDLTELDLSSFNTSNVTDMSSMFYICINLTSLNVSSFDTSNVTDMSVMFSECCGLTTLDLSNFNTSNVTTMNQMFYNCESLTSLNLSSFDMINMTDNGATYGMFAKCNQLSNLQAPKNINANMDFSDCPLTHDSLMDIINNLITTPYTQTKTLTLGVTNLAKLTDEEKVIATGKGWTLA